MAKILIVEDEKQMADFITLELKHEGYEVDICYDGEQGYESAINTNIELTKKEYELLEYLMKNRRN